MINFVALLAVVALILVLLRFSGLLPAKHPEHASPRIPPAIALVAAGLASLGIGLYAGSGGRGAGADQPEAIARSVAALSAAKPEGMFGTRVKPPVATAPEGGNAADPASNRGGDLGAMAERLEKKLEKDPQNGEGWLLLARAYLETRQHAKADASFARAAALLPPDAALLADWADAHVVARDRKWDDTARDIVKRALAADRNNLKALSLAGSEAFERGDYPAAIDDWQRLQKAAPADSMFARMAEANLAEARRRRSASADIQPGLRSR